MTRAAVLLAAGLGSRMGSVAKALLCDTNGESYLSKCVRTARSAEVHDLVVVVGPPFADEVAREARRFQLSVVRNPRPERGMASSVSLGFAHVALHFLSTQRALLWPVDHPNVDTSTLRTIVSRDGDIIVPTHNDRGGHPTVFARSTWPELIACTDAVDGARSVVNARPARVVRVAVSDSGVVRDIDQPTDL